MLADSTELTIIGGLVKRHCAVGFICVLFAFAWLAQSSLAHAANAVPHAVEMFEMYCYRTNASYEQTTKWAKLMHLAPMPTAMREAFSVDTTNGMGYIIHADKTKRKFMFLSTSKTNTCTVTAIGYDAKPVIASAKSIYKLRFLGKSDVGLQAGELYVPDGKHGTKDEALSLGMVALSYPKDMEAVSLSYMPPETVKSQLHW